MRIPTLPDIAAWMTKTDRRVAALESRVAGIPRGGTTPGPGAALYDANVLTNYDFEAGTPGWGRYFGSGTLGTTTASGLAISSRSLQVDNPADGQRQAVQWAFDAFTPGFGFGVPVVGGQIWRAEMSVRVPVGYMPLPNMRVIVWVGNDSNHVYGLFDPDGAQLVASALPCPADGTVVRLAGEVTIPATVNGLPTTYMGFFIEPFDSTVLSGTPMRYIVDDCVLKRRVA